MGADKPRPPASSPRATPFMAPRLEGGRFEDTEVPLEFLKDLAVLQEMVIEAARDAYIAAHPGRRRSPANFAKGVELRLTAIKADSVVPQINLRRPQPPSLPFQDDESETYFARARDNIIAAIGAAARGEPATDYLSPDTLGYFDRFGRGLRDGEEMVFSVSGSSGEQVRLTRHVRERLVRESGRVEETQRTSIRGRIPEADQDKETFEIQDARGRKIKAPLSPEWRARVIHAFANYHGQGWARFEGDAVIGLQGRALRFENMTGITLLDPLDIDLQFEQLAALRDGWLDGEGRALPGSELERLRSAFATHYPEGIPPPHLYPTESGGVQAEWTLAKTDVELEVDLHTHKGQWSELGLDRNLTEERMLDLTRRADWELMVARIRTLSPDPHDR